MKAKTHVKSEIAWQGGDMRVVMKHSVPGQKKKKLNWILQPVTREVSMKLPHLARFIGWWCRRWVTGIPVRVLCSMMGGK